MASGHSAPPEAQHRTVVVETDVAVAADIHTGTGPEIVGVPGVEWGMEVEVEAAAVGYMETSTVAAGASAKTVQ